MELKFEFKPREFLEAFKSDYDPVAKAASAAITAVSKKALKLGRDSIAQAPGHFGKRWQNALRSQVYPKPPKVSAGAAALIFLRSDYAGIFEHGGTIKGSPWLWLPLKTTPKTLGGKRVTPELFIKLVAPLFMVKRPGKPPLLVARLAANASTADSNKSLRALYRSAKNGSKVKGALRSVPVFVGFEAVKINPKFHIVQSCEIAMRDLASEYRSNFRR